MPVESRYLAAAGRRHPAAYGFAVGRYDATQPLVIDPGLVYSTYLGGNGSDRGNAIAVDAAGNAYVTGRHQLERLPHDRGGLRHAFNGNPMPS